MSETEPQRLARLAALREEAKKLPPKKTPPKSKLARELTNAMTHLSYIRGLQGSSEYRDHEFHTDKYYFRALRRVERLKSQIEAERRAYKRRSR